MLRDRATMRPLGKKGGFTMLEMVVMLSIVTAISALVLASFSGLSQGGALNRSARELALAIRRAQNMSLAVTKHAGLGIVPPGVGIHLSTASTESNQYLTFADIDTDPVTGKVVGNYNYSSQDQTLFSGVFDRRVFVSSLKGSGGSSCAPADIVFRAPEASMTIWCGGSGGQFLTMEPLTIELAAPGGQLKKTIIIRTSGQISIK